MHRVLMVKVFGKQNVKIDFTGTEYGSMDWIYLAQNRDQWRTLVNTALNNRVP
jgi:hypothetical protein